MRRWAMSWKWRAHNVVRPCRARVFVQECNDKTYSKEYDKLCLKIFPYMCRHQPLTGNRIAANFGNKDSSNKDKKPALFCNVDMVAK